LEANWVLMNKHILLESLSLESVKSTKESTAKFAIESTAEFAVESTTAFTAKSAAAAKTTAEAAVLVKFLQFKGLRTSGQRWNL
jgi:hypothetical protein